MMCPTATFNVEHSSTAACDELPAAQRDEFQQ
jgi:hypothetical protein